MKKVRNSVALKIAIPLVPVLCALAIFTGCGDTEAKARKELATIGKQFTVEEFVKCAASGDKYAVSLFLKAGMGVNSQKPNTVSALFLAAREGKNEVVQLLLKDGANPNLATDTGSTPLMNAAFNNNVEIVKVLLEAGANPNAKDEDGSTALIFAAKGAFTEVVKALLDKGADVKVTTHEGATAMDAALGDKLPTLLTVMGTNGFEAATEKQNQVIQLLRRGWAATLSRRFTSNALEAMSLTIVECVQEKKDAQITRKLVYKLLNNLKDLGFSESQMLEARTAAAKAVAKGRTIVAQNFITAEQDQALAFQKPFIDLTKEILDGPALSQR